MRYLLLLVKRNINKPVRDEMNGDTERVDDIVSDDLEMYNDESGWPALVILEMLVFAVSSSAQQQDLRLIKLRNTFFRRETSQ